MPQAKKANVMAAMKKKNPSKLVRNEEKIRQPS